MFSEQFLSTVSGPPLLNTTTAPKEVGIYHHTLTPRPAINATFKKSSCATNCVAANATHVFAAQQDKSIVHVYSRQKGNPEAYVTFQVRIKSLILLGNVIVLGTTEGSLILWEISSGRHFTTLSVHIQAISCLAGTRHHVITGSDDSNVHVWSLGRLVAMDPAAADPEPERTLSNHRGGITSLVVSQSSNANSSVCVTAAKDKTSIVWNHVTGEVYRTILFPAAPLSLAMDPFPRILIAALADGSVCALDFFGDKPMVGVQAVEASATILKAPPAIAHATVGHGPATCVALSHDASAFLTGHARGHIVKWSLNGQCTELTSLNAAVTNLVFLPPMPSQPSIEVPSIVKPGRPDPTTNVQMVRFATSLEHCCASPKSKFHDLISSPVVGGVMRDAIAALETAQESQEQEVVELSHIIDELGSVANVEVV